MTSSAGVDGWCPQCGEELFDEPIAVGHALRIALTCPTHGRAAVVDPLAGLAAG